jgi:hypothetical protein
VNLLDDTGLPELNFTYLTGCSQERSGGEWKWLNTATSPVTDPAAIRYRDAIVKQLETLKIALEQEPSVGTPRTASLWADVVSVSDIDACSYRWGVGDRVLSSEENAVLGASYVVMSQVSSQSQAKELDSYIRWWISYRLTALPKNLYDEAVSHDPNPTGNSYVDQMGFFRPPWYWELDRPFMVDRFLQWQIDTGQL